MDTIAVSDEAPPTPRRGRLVLVGSLAVLALVAAVAAFVRPWESWRDDDSDSSYDYVDVAALVVSTAYPELADVEPTVSTWRRPGESDLQVVRFDDEVTLPSGDVLSRSVLVSVDTETGAYRVSETNPGPVRPVAQPDLPPWAGESKADIGLGWGESDAIHVILHSQESVDEGLLVRVTIPEGAGLRAVYEHGDELCLWDFQMIEVRSATDWSVVAETLTYGDEYTFSEPLEHFPAADVALFVSVASETPMACGATGFPISYHLHLEVLGDPPSPEPTATPAPTQPPVPSPAPTETPEPTPAPTRSPEPSPAPTEMPEPTPESTAPPEPTGTPEPSTPTTRALAQDDEWPWNEIPRFDLLVLTDSARLDTQLGTTGGWVDVRRLLEDRWGDDPVDVAVLDFHTGELSVEGEVVETFTVPSSLADLDAYRRAVLEVREAEAGVWVTRGVDPGPATFEMLIIGGAEVVPFGTVPNPVSGATGLEETVATDLWYSDHSFAGLSATTTIDASNVGDILPEAELARVPDGNDLALLQAVFAQPSVPVLGRTTGFPDYSRASPTYVHSHDERPWTEAVRVFLGQLFPPTPGPERVLSPPETPLADPARADADLSFFVLHGSTNTSSWSGEEWVLDPTTRATSSGGGGVVEFRALYPVAFTTAEADAADTAGVVLAAVCYGAYIEHDPDVGDSVALTQLREGAFGFVGQTRSAYTPRADGDLDGLAPILSSSAGLHLYASARIAEGQHPSTALHRARSDLVEELAIRGLVRPEDVKTVLATVYYGLPYTGATIVVPRPDLWDVDLDRPELPAASERSSVTLSAGDPATVLHIDGYAQLTDIAGGTVFNDTATLAGVDLAPDAFVVLAEHHTSDARWPGEWIRARFHDGIVTIDIGSTERVSGTLREFPSVDGAFHLTWADLDAAGVAREISSVAVGGLIDGEAPRLDRPDHSDPTAMITHAVTPPDLTGTWRASNGLSYDLDRVDDTWLRYEWRASNGEIGWVTVTATRLYAVWGAGGLGERTSGEIGWDDWGRPVELIFHNGITFTQQLPPPSDPVWWTS